VNLAGKSFRLFVIRRDDREWRKAGNEEKRALFFGVFIKLKVGPGVAAARVLVQRSQYSSRVSKIRVRDADQLPGVIFDLEILFRFAPSVL